jgi:hypothetical protein
MCCKRCGQALTSARLKGPTTGWYCTPCYVATFVTSVINDAPVVGLSELEALLMVGADLDLVREYQSTHLDSPEDIYKRLCAGELQELLRGH